MVEINIHRNWSYHVCCLIVSALALFNRGFWYAAFLLGASTLVTMVHELSHAMVARIVSFKVKKIRVWPWHGYTEMDRNDGEHENARWLAIVFAGPVGGWVATFAIYTITLYFELPLGLTGALHLLYLAVSADTVINLLPLYNFDGRQMADTLKVILADTKMHSKADDTQSDIPPQPASSLPTANEFSKVQSVHADTTQLREQSQRVDKARNAA